MFEENLGQNPPLRQNRIVTIFRKQVFKQAVGGAKEKSEIAAISNKYIDTFDELIDSFDTKSSDHSDSPNWPRLIDKGLYNALKSKDGSSTFLKEDCLDEDISITSLELAPKIRNF